MHILDCVMTGVYEEERQTALLLDDVNTTDLDDERAPDRTSCHRQHRRCCKPELILLWRESMMIILTIFNLPTKAQV